MHGDLSPTIHTPECNLIIKQLQECHAESKVGKFFGKCNKIDKLLVDCLRKERKANQSENLRKSAERQKRIQEKISCEQNSQ
ncbi:COX assembly mitochondrial protein 2 like [Pseudolycoriella hygida]|uniref:COX assembly mitochondrial protein n=1 Tax=Pseudolycoriella hygida TaxID=35572 RepID=A0A9Q0RYU3_9DIPT|nr:COX assembly mitochondrial protein 2 like [Pseudolycoriella hygida]